MSNSNTIPLDELLLAISKAEPKPWHPKNYAQETNIPRDSLDTPLNELRMMDLIKLTDWAKGVGQGYILTSFGETVIKDNDALRELRQGNQLTEEILETSENSNQTDELVDTLNHQDYLRQQMINPTNPAPVTYILICLNLCYFLACMVGAISSNINPFSYAIFGNMIVANHMGGLSTESLIEGNYWRLFAYSFIHFNILHLAMNLFCLYFVGKIMEPLWGSRIFLYIYFTASLGAGLIATTLSPGTPDKSYLIVGASGGIWAILFSSLIWLYLNRSFIPPPLQKSWLLTWKYPFIFCLLGNFLPNVSFNGHLGGVLTGFLESFILYYTKTTNPAFRQLLYIIALLIVPCFLLIICISRIDMIPAWHEFRIFHEQVRHTDLNIP